MLVIHGIWANNALCLWAEDSRRPPRVPPPPGRRPSRAARPHPFASDPDTLAEVLADLPEPFPGLARKAIEDELTLHLPTVADGPLASPELIRPPDAEEARPGSGTGRVTLAPWRVPALIFEPAAALDLLTGLKRLAPTDPGTADVAMAEPSLADVAVTGPSPAEASPAEASSADGGSPDEGSTASQAAASQAAAARLRRARLRRTRERRTWALRPSRRCRAGQRSTGPRWRHSRWTWRAVAVCCRSWKRTTLAMRRVGVRC